MEKRQNASGKLFLDTEPRVSGASVLRIVFVDRVHRRIAYGGPRLHAGFCNANTGINNGASDAGCDASGKHDRGQEDKDFHYGSIAAAAACDKRAFTG